MAASRSASLFQSAPRPRGRGDLFRRVFLVSLRRFNPRPARAGGATFSPHVSRPSVFRFNPRPARAGGATDPREDTAVAGVVSIRAPPARAGRPRQEMLAALAVQVSIRAPPARAGRPIGPASMLSEVVFQSAPRPRGRGDQFQSEPRWSHSCFNPRPARAGGATSSGGLNGRWRRSFNPRPARAGGATTRRWRL